MSQESRGSVEPRSAGRHSEVVNGAGPGAAQDHPAELAYLWSLCRSRGEHGLDTKPPRAGEREGDDSAHLSAALCRQGEVVPPEPEGPFDADVSRDGHDPILRPPLLQGFAVGSRSVPASVCHCRPDWAPCLRSDVGRINKALKGWERLQGTRRTRCLGSSCSPSQRSSTSTATSRCPRRRSHRRVPSSRRDRVAERKQIDSATPSRNKDREQNPAARRHDRIGLVKPPVAGTAGQLDCQDSKEGRAAVLLHRRCVAQGTARCGSEAASGVLRHHAAHDAPPRAEQR